MNTSNKHSAWALAGLLLTLIAGSPVWADDVELLLSTPGASNAAKPNILFIIDSSGSMTTVEPNQVPYDANEVYTGPCDLSRYYWTTNSSIPSCGGEYQFNKSVFYCQQGINQLDSAGSYTDTMAMYRYRRGSWKWQRLSRSETNRAVECKADSGEHGYGSNPKDEPYAQAGSNIPPYTADENREVSWGSSPTHLIITVYDSNYLNWYYNPPGGNLSRSDVVKAVTKNVLGSVRDVNVGIMDFNWSQGGTVLHGIKDLDSNRTEADDVIDSIPASGWTPLSETMYEAALYWRGMPGTYGNPDATDSDARVSKDPLIYKQPAEYACSKNFTVLLTDGAPTEDIDAYTKVPTLPEFDTVMGRGYCDGGNVNGACLDDVSEYLSKVDINPALPGKQSVTTYTIGFSVDLPILKRTAENSGGEYYLASDVKSLTKALTDIVTNIFDRDISFTAPAIAVNAFNRTQHLNDLYVSVFRAADQVHWPGNIKKYTIKEGEVRDKNDINAVDPATGFFADNATNFWSTESTPDGTDVNRGGVANVLPHPDVRKVYTNNLLGDLTLASNSLSTTNILSFAMGDFGLSGAEGEPDMFELIDWARGKDVKDVDNDPTTENRYAMGDTLHSQPAAVVYGDTGGGYRTIIFNATNDGYLHAVDAATGEEMWAFIPRELLPNLKEFYFDENADYKTYGLDGDVVPIIADFNGDGVIEVGTDFVYIVFGMRRGGDNYYMLDVTNNEKPYVKWIKTFPESGQSWSPPVVAKVKINSAAVQSPQDAVLVIGGGYDTTHDSPGHPTGPDVEGAGIYMLDLESGDPLWRVGEDSFADLSLPSMTRAIPSRIRVVDMNGDNFADRMYAADLGGQIWRFDITNGATPNNLVAGGVIAQLGAEGLGSPGPGDTRRLYNTPDVAIFNDDRMDRRFLSISIGSGYRAHPLDNSATDRFYSLRDEHVFNALTQAQYDSYPIIKDADLMEVSGQYGTVIPAGGAGWKLTLSSGEKVLSDSRTFDDKIYFVTMEPATNSDDPCQAGLSINRLYRVSVDNGDPVIDYGAPVPTDPVEIDEARVTKLEQGGIAPVPVFLFPSPTDPNCTGQECTPEPIGCIGVECFDPEFTNSPVRTLWVQDGIE
ncbi:MAG: PilC/PilY family type IV pilus protein [Gammaproteobacteria bacterium]|nr:PilC/PilY family type IV pilus protein [Gammaproteobacteria bacterium]